MKYIKPFLSGFDYAVKRYNQIEDHHFHSYPGATWHDLKTNHVYRKGIITGRKYMQYRLEILAFSCLLSGTVVLLFSW